jgi:hypothetical protein
VDPAQSIAAAVYQPEVHVQRDVCGDEYLELRGGAEQPVYDVKPEFRRCGLGLVCGSVV